MKNSKEKEMVIDLLKKQIAKEGMLINLYEETEAETKSRPVRHSSWRKNRSTWRTRY